MQTFCSGFTTNLTKPRGSPARFSQCLGKTGQNKIRIKLRSFYLV
jgi:hypothetical protein